MQAVVEYVERVIETTPMVIDFAQNFDTLTPLQQDHVATVMGTTGSMAIDLRELNPEILKDACEHVRSHTPP